MKTQIEKLVKNIENRKDGIYKSYYLEKSNAISNNKNEVVFAYKNGRGTGYISVDGVNHKMYIPDNFFKDKSDDNADLSIYIGNTTHYIGEETGLLYDLYAVRFEEIQNAIEIYEKELDDYYIRLDEWKKESEAKKDDRKNIEKQVYGYMRQLRDRTRVRQLGGCNGFYE